MCRQKRSEKIENSVKKILNKEPTISFERQIRKPVSGKPLAIRTTKRAYNSVRNKQDDKLASFVEMDKTTFKSAHDELVNNAFESFVKPLIVSIYRE